MRDAMLRSYLQRILRASVRGNSDAPVHAVTRVGNLYDCYDANGNMIKRAGTKHTAE